MNRREALRTLGNGFGLLGLAQLLADTAQGNTSLLAKAPHFPAKAKHVLFLFLNGGPSQVDTFDPKPKLTKHDGEPMPPGLSIMDVPTGHLFGSPFKFKKYGQSGIEVSEIFPGVGELIDDICVIRSMYTDNPLHETGLFRMNTGHLQPGHPSMGSWITYGLGTENQNLPGYVVLCPGQPAGGGAQLYTASYLPGIYQGTHISNQEEKETSKLIPHIRNSQLGLAEQRKQLDLIGKLTQLGGRDQVTDPQVEATIQSMEMAYRMQTEAIDVFDIKNESEATRARYGDGEFARGCLMAKRLLERGVRMVQLYYGAGIPWDSHTDILVHRKLGFLADRPIAALLQDLKISGLLKETIVLIGGEFGRAPANEPDAGLAYGRGHDHNGFTTLVAGGGFKGGLAYGATDDLGFQAVENRVHVNDLHATVLHQLGLDHEKLTFQYGGRDFRLTDLGGKVVKDIVT